MIDYTMNGPLSLLRAQCRQRLKDALEASETGWATAWREDTGIYDLVTPRDEARLASLGCALYRARLEATP